MEINENQQENAGKEKKKFEDAMAKLLALMGGKDNLYPTRKVPASIVDSVVEELLAEDKKKAQISLKEGISKLLAANITAEDEIAKKKKELEELEKKKNKEFVDEANRLFNKISDWGALEKRYKDSLQKASGSQGPAEGAVDDKQTGPAPQA